jgi:hypothetical protein
MHEISAHGGDYSGYAMSLHVLLYMLDSAVSECATEQDEWLAMQRETKIALYEPKFLAEAQRLCSEQLKLDNYITEHADELKARLKEAFQIYTDETRDCAERERYALQQLPYIANTAWIAGSTQEATIAALERINVQFNESEDNGSIICYFTILYLLDRFRFSDRGEYVRAYDDFVRWAKTQLAKYL